MFGRIIRRSVVSAQLRESYRAEAVAIKDNGTWKVK